MYGDIGFWAHVHTGAALAVEIVQTLETFLDTNTFITDQHGLLLAYLAAGAVRVKLTLAGL